MLTQEIVYDYHEIISEMVGLVESFTLFWYGQLIILWVEFLPMIKEFGFQSQGRVILKTQKWYFMPPCLTLSIIRYGLRVKVEQTMGMSSALLNTLVL